MMPRILRCKKCKKKYLFKPDTRQSTKYCEKCDKELSVEYGWEEGFGEEGFIKRKD